MEQQYLNLLDLTLQTGVKESNRTGIDCYTIPGAMLKHDMSLGFPALTSKKLAFGQVKGEAVGFIRGIRSAAKFRELGCKIWDQNANENKDWLANPYRNGVDDLGRIYGQQWRTWKGPNGEVIDQLAVAIRTVVENPSSRRIIVNAWQPAELDKMALPPCHMLFQLIPHNSTKKLHMCMYQRSCDMFLGVPFNIASYALLLELIAKWTGYQAGQLTMFLADVHIYENHVEQVKEQLNRSTFDLPKLELDNLVIPTTPGEITLALDCLTPDQIQLIGYQSHEAIKAPMAV